MMDIDLQIEGVSDRLIAGAIRKRVRALRRNTARPGEWRVSVGPSETRGEWDLGLREGLAGWRLATLTGPIEGLPDIVEHRLRALLEQGAGGLTAALVSRK